MAKRYSRASSKGSRKGSGYRSGGRRAVASRASGSRGVHTVKLVIQHAQAPSTPEVVAGPEGQLMAAKRETRAKF